MAVPQEIIDARKAEVDQYEANITLYQIILSTLPQEWPARLEAFKNRKDHQQAVTEVDDTTDLELLSKLLYMEQVKATIKTEILELTKANAILAALLAQ